MWRIKRLIEHCCVVKSFMFDKSTLLNLKVEAVSITVEELIFFQELRLPRTVVVSYPV